MDMAASLSDLIWDHQARKDETKSLKPTEILKPSLDIYILLRNGINWVYIIRYDILITNSGYIYTY